MSPHLRESNVDRQPAPARGTHRAEHRFEKDLLLDPAQPNDEAEERGIHRPVDDPDGWQIEPHHAAGGPIEESRQWRFPSAGEVTEACEHVRVSPRFVYLGDAGNPASVPASAASSRLYAASFRCRPSPEVYASGR